MLCEKCHQHEATVFITKIIDRISETSNLCIECSEAAGFPVDRELKKVLETANCQYCGGRSCTGNEDHLSGMLGDRPRSFMCGTCEMEFLRFAQKELYNKAKDFKKSTPEDQLAAIRVIRDKVDAHMSQWVSQKKGGSGAN